MPTRDQKIRFASIGEIFVVYRLNCSNLAFYSIVLLTTGIPLVHASCDALVDQTFHDGVVDQTCMVVEVVAFPTLVGSACDALVDQTCRDVVDQT